MHCYDTQPGTKGIYFWYTFLFGGGEICTSLEIMPCQVLFYQPLHTARPEYVESTVQDTFFYVRLPCLAQHKPALTSRCGTDRAGRGALEPPAEDGARTK